MRCAPVLAILLAAVLAAGIAPAPTAAQPVPICPGSAADPFPPYADLGRQPNVAVWEDVVLDPRGVCETIPEGAAAMVVAVSGRFRHGGGVEDLAARIGAVSTLEGLPYWSVSDGRWRPLISSSHAIEGPGSVDPRPDFSLAEVLSGRTLYMAQRETRSNGRNIYTIDARLAREDQIVVTISNHTGIRFLVATLFEPGALVSTLVFTRIRGDEWGYYGLMIARDGSVTGRTASFINRAAAFERFFTGQRPDADPPLAP